MVGEFSNKVAVVTGGSRGIGREIAVGFARSGAQTVIVSSSADNIASAAKTITSAGLAPLTLTADLRTLDGCQHVLDSVKDRFGRCDGTRRCNCFACRREICSRRRHDDGLSARPGEVGCDLPADAATAASDNRYLIGELP